MIYSDRVPLAEPVVIPDIYASGLARIEDIGGGNLRFTFFTKQRSTMFTDEREEHVVVLRLIMPKDAVKAAHKATDYVLEGIEGGVDAIYMEQCH